MNTFVNNIKFNFLFVDLYSFGRTWVYPESRLPYNMLRYITKGEAAFFIDGKETIVHAGEVIYLPQDSTLSCHALGEDFEFYSIRFASSVIYGGGNILTDYFHIPTVIRDTRGEALEYFQNIYNWVRSEEKCKMFWVRGYLDILIGYVICQGNTSVMPLREEPETEFSLEKIKLRLRKSDVKIDPRIQLVVDYLNSHSEEKYTIKKMSDMAGLSESRFRTLFHQQVGKKPLEYLNEIRVMVAARKLMLTTDNISDIAYSLGYNDVNYFIRVFKKYFCMTPKQYRDNAKE